MAIHLTKQAHVHAALRAAIIDGRLPAGSRLVIDELARRHEVSIIPVREALQQLQTEGLVEIRPHTGVQVSACDPASAPELFALMEGLESAAVRLFCERRADAGPLDERLAILDAARLAGDGARWAEANASFHRAIFAAAALPLGGELADRVLSRWERLRRAHFVGRPGPQMEQSDREHRALLAALRAHDAEAAGRLSAQHSRAALAAYLG